MNGYIRAQEVRLVAPDGSQIGVKKLAEALWLADQLGLDLVEVAPDANPPVCRLMDYGKFKYEQSVRDREARKKQTRTTIKELRLTPYIDPHDYEIQKRKAIEFLGDGDKVKFNVRFRGRQAERPDFGKRLLDRMVDELTDVAVVEQPASLEGRSMTLVMAPNRKASRPKTQDEDPITAEAPETAETPTITEAPATTEEPATTEAPATTEEPAGA